MSRSTEFLTIARATLDNPDRWTKDAFARDENGCLTGVGYPNAKCWCLLGAMEEATYDRPGREHRTEADLNYGVASASEFLRRAIGQLGYTRSESDVSVHIPHFNDDPKTAHGQVLQVLDLAIQLSAQHDAENPGVELALPTWLVGSHVDK